MECLDENEVVDFVDGRSSGQRRRHIQAHLDHCDGCRQVVAHSAEALLPTAASETMPSLSDSTELQPGDWLGRYQVVKKLGSGSMGAVYEAEDRELKRRVALKIVRPDGRGDDAHLRLRLLREARTASAVQHPHVVTVHDVLTLSDGSPVMVMDLLEGEPLRARLARDGCLSVEEALKLGDALLSALEAAHALGVVHRDLKPDNIFLVEPDAEVRIVDFGIAKLTALDGPAAETAGLTETGMLVGTPHYMAPEQAFADDVIDERADLWAVGVILYECMSGRRPIEGHSVGQVLRRLAHLKIEPLGEIAPHVPATLGALVMSLLCEHDDRPASAAIVRRALSRCDATPHRAASATVDDSGQGLSSSLRRIAGGRRWPFAIAAAVAAVLVYRGTRPEPPTLSSEPAREAATAATSPPNTIPAPNGLPGTTVSPNVTSPAASHGHAAPPPGGRLTAPSTRPQPHAPPPSPSSVPTSTTSPHGPGGILTKPPF